MKCKYIIFILVIGLIIYSINNSRIEAFGDNMIGIDAGGAAINVPVDCTLRNKSDCKSTIGCFWGLLKGDKYDSCNQVQGMTHGYGLGGKNIYIPSKCFLRDRSNCEAALGCTWQGESQEDLQKSSYCKITPDWVERVDINNAIVHFQKKCSKRPINYCMIGDECYINGSYCYDKPHLKDREKDNCRIDRSDILFGKRVDICKDPQKHWTPEHDQEEDHRPIFMLNQTKTCWHCPIQNQGAPDDFRQTSKSNDNIYSISQGRQYIPMTEMALSPQADGL